MCYSHALNEWRDNTSNHGYLCIGSRPIKRSWSTTRRCLRRSFSQTSTSNHGWIWCDRGCTSALTSINSELATSINTPLTLFDRTYMRAMGSERKLKDYCANEPWKWWPRYSIKDSTPITEASSCHRNYKESAFSSLWGSISKLVWKDWDSMCKGTRLATKYRHVTTMYRHRSSWQIGSIYTGKSRRRKFLGVES